MKNRPLRGSLTSGGWIPAALLAISVAVGPAMAEECMEAVGRWPYGPANDVVLDGNYAYFGSGSALIVADISDRDNPSKVGEVTFSDVVRGLDLSGSHVFVAAHSLGLRVVDVADPTSPVEVGFWEGFGSDAWDVAVSGNFAYVANGQWGLQIIDVTDPTAPVERGSADTDGWALDIDAAGNFVYLAAQQDGLRVYDVTDPDLPVDGNHTTSPGFTLGVTVSGGYAYVSSRDLGLRVFDIAEPSTPVETGFIETPADVRDAAVSEPYVFVAASESGLRVVEVSDPANPVEIGSVDIPGDASEASVLGNLVGVAAGHGGVHFIDVSAPASLSEVSYIDTPGTTELITVSGSFAYTSDYPSGMRVLDISDPLSPGALGSVELSDVAEDIETSGDHVYVAARHSGVCIIDVSDPSNPSEVNVINTPTFALEIEIRYPLLYESDYLGDFRIVDISDPLAPSEVGIWDPPGGTSQLALSGSFAFLYVLFSGLHTLDLSDPAVPRSVGLFEPPGSLRDIEVSGQYAYLSVFTDGFRVFDIADPATPEEVGVLDRSGGAGQADLSGSYAAVTWGGPGVLLADISIPSAPTEVTMGHTYGNAFDVAVQGRYAYVADGDAGMVVLDLFNCCQDAPPAFALLSPPDGATGTACDLDLSWEGAAEALYYDIYIDTVDPPTERVGIEHRFSEISVALSPSVQYHWKVEAHNGCGTTESATRTFTTGSEAGAFALLTPADGAVDQGCALVLDWEDSPGAMAYDVYLDTADPPLVLESAGESISELSVSVAPETLYFWKVVGKGGCVDAESEVFSFATCPELQAFSLLTPLDGADLAVAGNPYEITLTWEANPTAASYSLYLGTDPTPPLYREGLTDSRYDVSDLSVGVTYYWTVEAVNACGTISCADGPRSFSASTSPQAAFFTSAPGCAGKPVSFHDASSGGTPPYSYVWSFGDGLPESPEQHPEHVYALPGTYDVRLTVIDFSGGSDAVERTVTVSYGRPASTGNTLMAVKDAPDVRLEWQEPPGSGPDDATNYAVYFTNAVSNPFDLMANPLPFNTLLWTTTSEATYSHSNALDPFGQGNSVLHFYRVLSQNGCGDSHDAPSSQSVEEMLTDPATGEPVDTWAFWMASGVSLEIRIDRFDDGGGLSTLDLTTELIDPDDAVVATGDDDIPCSISSACPSGCPFMTYDTAVEGLYRLVVRDTCVEAPGTEGRYKIYVNASAPGGGLRQLDDDSF